MQQTLRQKVIHAVARGRHSVRRHVPPGFRWPVGLLLICFGVVGFLPVVGFWMIPLGIAVAAMDIRPLWRRWQAWRASQSTASVADLPAKEKTHDRDSPP